MLHPLITADAPRSLQPYVRSLHSNPMCTRCASRSCRCRWCSASKVSCGPPAQRPSTPSTLLSTCCCCSTSSSVPAPPSSRRGSSWAILAPSRITTHGPAYSRTCLARARSRSCTPSPPRRRPSPTGSPPSLAQCASPASHDFWRAWWSCGPPPRAPAPSPACCGWRDSCHSSCSSVIGWRACLQPLAPAPTLTRVPALAPFPTLAPELNLILTPA